jgi:RimJ/RimL family protein N-acetyltransferase
VRFKSIWFWLNQVSGQKRTAIDGTFGQPKGLDCHQKDCMKDVKSVDVTLKSDDVLLRPWKADDAKWYVESRDEEVFRWTKEKRDLTIGEVEEGIRQANTGSEAICLAIVDNKNMGLLGNIALAFREKNRTSGEIMYWLAPRGRGRGIAVKSVKLLSQWAFDTLELERVILKTHAGNSRSQFVAERAGFQRQDYSGEKKTEANIVWFELTDS